MRNGKQVGTALLAAAVVSVFAAGLTGCDEDQKKAPAGAPALGVSNAPAMPTAENPATAKPKDHPAH